jgi:hypothetical protein
VKGLKMNYILNRLREPSTYAGIMGLVIALGVQVPVALYDAVAQVLIAAAGLAAVLLPESKKK